MNRDQYAQKQAWRQGESSASGAVQAPQRQAGGVRSGGAPNGQPLAGAGTARRMAYLLHRSRPDASTAGR